jgi:predicted nucleic acid-binding protein
MSGIVLDTSVLVPDFRLRNKLFRSVLRTARDLRDHIYIPKIVIDELINKFREGLQSSYDSLRQHENRIMDLIDSRLGERRIDVSEQVAIYADWLQDELSRNEIQQINYPYISHESLVKRALARRKPFSGEGQRGYRDAVLWETILARSKPTGEEILFVSRNIRDFADPEDSHKLHSQLLDDLCSLRHGRSSVQFFAGLEDLLARGLSPRQRFFPELAEQVKNGKLSQRELKPWLTIILPDILNRADVNTHIFPTRRLTRRLTKDWTIGKIHSIDDLLLNSTSRLMDHTILIVLFSTFSADVLPTQPELLPEEGREARIQSFIGYVAVEVELETKAVVSVEVNKVIWINE